MPPWLFLSVAEARRVRAVLRGCARSPVVPLAVAGAAAGALWLAMRGSGAVAAAAEQSPSVGSLIAMSVAGFGLVVGLLSAQVAPRIAMYDAQLQLLPLSRMRRFLGATAVPLAVVWGCSVIPLAVFEMRLYRAMALEHASAWTAAGVLSYLSATAAGAGVAELLAGTAWRALRVLLSRLSLALAAPAAGAVAAAAGGHAWWLGGTAFLALSSPGGHGPFAALAINLVLFAAAAAAWLSLGAGSTVRTRGPARTVVRLPARCRGRWPMFVWWLVAPVLRESRFGAIALLGVLGSSALVLAGPAGVDPQGLLALLAPFFALAAGAEIAMLLSERLHAAGWFWRLVPGRRSLVGLWWWLGAAILAIAISLISLVVVLVSGTDAGPSLPAAVVASGFGAAAVGRLVPWNSRSQTVQLLATLVYFAVLGGAIAATVWLAPRTGATAGVLLVAAALAGASAIVSVRTPWRSAWDAA